MNRKRKPLRAIKAELEYIKEVESRSVEERLAAGELEIVPFGEIPDVLRSFMRKGRRGVWTELPERDLRRLRTLRSELENRPASCSVSGRANDFGNGQQLAADHSPTNAT